MVGHRARATFLASVLGATALTSAGAPQALAAKDPVINLAPTEGGEDAGAGDVAQGERGDEDAPDPSNPSVDPGSLEAPAADELLDPGEVAPPAAEDAGPESEEEVAPETVVEQEAPVPAPAVDPAPAAEPPAPAPVPAPSAPATSAEGPAVPPPSASAAAARERADATARASASARRSYAGGRDQSARQAATSSSAEARSRQEARAAVAPDPRPVVAQEAGSVASEGPTGAAVSSTGVSRRAPAPGPAGTYVIQTGDSLWSIAAERLGPDATQAEVASAVTDLWILNRDRAGFGDPSRISVGAHLLLPSQLR